MRTLNYLVDVEKIRLNESEKKFVEENGQKVLLENLMNQGLNGRYPQGVPSVKQRAYGRFLLKLDADKEGVLKLEEAEYDLLKEVFLSEDTKFHPGQTRLVLEYSLLVEGCKKE